MKCTVDASLSLWYSWGMDTKAKLKVGPAMRDARTAAGLSREAVAGMVGKSLSTILRWEAGDTSPTVEDLPALAAALGVSVSALLGFTDG